MPPVDWLALGRAAYPAIACPDAALAPVAADDGPAAAHAVDYFLARACAAGDPVALQILERDHLARAAAWLRGRERDPQIVDEVCQRVRARVLVAGPDAAPRIADYAGLGALFAWLRVVVVREHASHHRARAGVALDDALALDAIVAPGEATPELAALRRTLAPALRAAVRAAIAALPPRARTLLRMAYLDAMPLGAIARTYGVDKSTVSRWLAAARADVADAVERALRAALGDDELALASVLGLVRSELDLSLAGLLAA